MDCCNSSDDEEYEEIAEEILDIHCLFCESRFTTFDKIFQHINEEHQFDFVTKCKSFNLDTFQYIKLINYIRKNSIKPSQVEELFNSKSYDSEDYLKPTLEDDHLLMFDSDDIDDSECSQESNLKLEDFKQFSDFENHYACVPKEKILQDYFALKCKHDEVLNSINEMSEFIKETVTEDNDNSARSSNVTNLDHYSDSGYISSYSHFGIHHIMLSDKPRTLAYKDAIIENSFLFKGKSVLDIGCGTGILSLFAAKAGADIVVAIDQSEIIYNAMEIIRQNGYENVIKTVKGKLESINFKSLGLPTHYDIIISEWMGYFLLFEGMIDTVIYARDHLMKNEGKLLPNRSKIFFAAFSDSDFYENNVDFWNDVYGFKMSSMINDVTSEAIVDHIGAQNISSSTETISELDISNCSIESALKVNSIFELKFEKDSTIHGFVGWFDCYFDSMVKTVVLSTSPFAESTHWKQTVFPLNEPISIEAGRSISGLIEISRKNSNARELMVKIDVKDYNLSLEYNIGC